MKTKLLILEDQSLTLEDLIDRVSCFYDFEIITASTSEEALENVPDMALCDVQLGTDQRNGIEVAKLINANKVTPVIFITKIQDDSAVYEQIESLNFPVFYIAKPVANNALRKAISNALNSLSITDSDKLSTTDSFSIQEGRVLMRNGTGLYYVDIEKEILYLEANRETTKVFTTVYDHPIVVSIHLKAFLKKVERFSSKLVRSSRYTAVNVLKLRKILDSKRNLSKNKFLQLEGIETQIPLGVKYKSQFLERFHSI